LEWVQLLSKAQIFFYDEHQSIMPKDVDKDAFASLNIKAEYKLTNQMRVA